ncbi:hypothetical protein [Acrocarpospora corrugata]|uniref:hypothetical protein n=1 Tax=Acrocarpospora corrugata TaxID=35763 RepID=UPI0031DAFEB8
MLIGAAILTAALAGGGIVYAVSGNDTPVTQPATNPGAPEDATAPLADDPATEAEAPADSGEPTDGDAPAGDNPGNTAQGGQEDPPAQNPTTKNDKPSATTPRTPSTTKPRPTTAPNENIDEIDRGNGAGAVDPAGPVGGY